MEGYIRLGMAVIMQAFRDLDHPDRAGEAREWLLSTGWSWVSGLDVELDPGAWLSAVDKGASGKIPWQM